MLLIIGLGNPEKKYEKTRHNIGREVVDAFAKEHEFAPWKMDKKLFAEVTKGRIGNQEVLLVIPTVFMNESGRAVQSVVSHLKFQIPALSEVEGSNLIVVHDDLDLPLGTLRFSFDASSGGQRGVQSIIQVLGTKKFTRLRIGVAGETRSKTNAAVYVLRKFSRLREQLIVLNTEKRAVAALADYLKYGIEHVRQKYN